MELPFTNQGPIHQSRAFNCADAAYPMTQMGRFHAEVTELTILLPQGQLLALEWQARCRGISLAKLIRQLLHQYLNNDRVLLQQGSGTTAPAGSDWIIKETPER